MSNKSIDSHALEALDLDDLDEDVKWTLIRSMPASYWLKCEAFAATVFDRAEDLRTIIIDGVVYIPAEGGRRELVECKCGVSYSDCWVECPKCGRRRVLKAECGWRQALRKPKEIQ